MDAAPFPLTFGIELEFIVLYDPEMYKDKLQASEGIHWSKDCGLSLHHKHGILVRRHMIQILNENEFPTNGYLRKDFSKWTVSTDDTVTPIHTRENWYPIELKTPALPYSRGALEQVEKAVELLVSEFRLHTDEHCGLHVHIGTGTGTGIARRGFHVRTLKNLCALITVFDRQLESLHPPSRIQNRYAKSPRRVCAPGAPLREKLAVIQDLDTVDNLVYLFHRTDEGEYDNAMAYNFMNLNENRYADPLGTIEFRQHRGTLDPSLILNWVMVTSNLVHMSSTTTPCPFHPLIETHLSSSSSSSTSSSPSSSPPSSYTILNLLTDLHLPHLATFYARRIFPHYGTINNPLVITDFEEGEQLDPIDLSSQGEFDTEWEKEFVPRPAWEKDGGV